VNEVHLTFADEASESSFRFMRFNAFPSDGHVDVDQVQRLFRMALVIYFELELFVRYTKIGWKNHYGSISKR